MNQIEIYTDGACKGNPGPGGWGAVLMAGGPEKELFGGEAATTNNRMELTAVIEALAALKRPCHVILYLDSEYVRKGITEWIPGWKARGWRTAAKQAGQERRPVASGSTRCVRRRPPDRMALGQGPLRRPGQRARRHAGQPGRRAVPGATTWCRRDIADAHPGSLPDRQLKPRQTDTFAH